MSPGWQNDLQLRNTGLKDLLLSEIIKICCTTNTILAIFIIIYDFQLFYPHLSTERKYMSSDKMKRKNKQTKHNDNT